MKIRNLYSGDQPRNVERTIMVLLRKVPAEYLVGLDQIVIVSKSAQKGKKDAAGLYIPKYKDELARIELAIENIYEGMPRLFYYLPFVSRFMVARVLYHEIGHHYQFTKKRLRKGQWEHDAENFAKIILKKEFFWWLTVMSPFFKLRRLILEAKKPRDSTSEQIDSIKENKESF